MELYSNTLGIPTRSATPAVRAVSDGGVARFTIVPVVSGISAAAVLWPRVRASPGLSDRGEKPANKGAEAPRRLSRKYTDGPFVFRGQYRRRDRRRSRDLSIRRVLSDIHPPAGTGGPTLKWLLKKASYRSFCGHGFHEKACSCQPPPLKIFRGIHKGAKPSCGGSRGFCGVGGTLLPRLSPEGKRERGFNLPCCRRRYCSSAPIADSPCFHSHSSREPPLRCHLGSSISTGAAISESNWKLRCQSLRSTVTSQSPGPGDWANSTQPNLSGCFRHALTVPQRFVYFACCP